MVKGNPSPVTRNSNPQSANAPQPPGTVANIIVFGETGVGKSSLIRMLDVEGTPPRVSDEAPVCTTDTASYLITIGNAKDVGYRVWDTPGLNGGRGNTITALEALLKIHGLAQSLIRSGQRVDLLIYCIRAPRFRDILRVNYDLVAKTIFRQSVPVVLVVTGLENHENMDGWWEDNKEYFDGMAFEGHACVTTTKGKKVGNSFVFEEEYTYSKRQVQTLIQRSTLNGTVPLIEDIEKEIRTYMADYNSRVQRERGLLGLFSRYDSNGDPLSTTIDNALSQVPAPSTGGRLYKTKDDDKPNNHAQPDRQSATRGGTLSDTPSSISASKGFLPKSNISKDNGGIDPSGSNANTDPSPTMGINPPSKTKNAPRFTPEIFKSKRADDANAVLPCTTVDEDRTKPNTGANEDPSASISKVNISSDSRINKLDDSNQVTDDEDSESSETDSDDSWEGNPSNIIVFGETGVGKSSLIRMLGGASKKQPRVSGDAAGCTTDTAYYSITIGNGENEVKYRIWDTPGLGEGGNGTVPTLVALQRIHDRVQKLEGVNLLVYCIRGAEYKDIQQNYDLVARVVCGGIVPVVAVVSWLENEDNMESWWKENKGHLKKMIKLRGHACVTTTKGKKDGDKFMFQQEYDDSKERVQSLIRRRHLSTGIKPDPIADLEDAFKKYMDEHNSGNVTQERKMAGRLMRLFME